jgi:hypothetical protein
MSALLWEFIALAYAPLDSCRALVAGLPSRSPETRNSIVA